MAVLAGGTVQGVRTVGWAFTDRRVGVSEPPFDLANLATHVGDASAHVAANRERLLGHIGEDGAVLATMSQVHGATVRVVDGPGDAGSADALVTQTPGVVLLAQTADCVPVLLADADAGVVAAVHAGWKGAAADVVARAVEVMTRLGAREIEAVIGPAICGSCYEVGPEVLEAVLPVLPSATARTRTGTSGLDLRRGLHDRLAGLGIAADVVGPCTFESPDLYSYRRDGRTGRQAGAIWISAEA